MNSRIDRERAYKIFNEALAVDPLRRAAFVGERCAGDLPCEPSADICRLFTPSYAAPEQFSGEPVTVAADVFGLGALGHRLLTCRAPFAKAASPLAYMLAVTAQDVDLPSHTAAAAGMDPPWVRELEGDLDAILTKALARDPARRYATAEQMQGDLHRHLDGLPVHARNPTVRYRTVKLAHRLANALNLGAPRRACVRPTTTMRRRATST
jgi:serine/threonine protein kinase